MWCVYRLLPSPLKDAVEVSTWRRCYTMQEVNSALSKIQLVGYSQKIVSVDTFVSAFMRATPVLSSWGLVALLVKLPCHLCAHPRKKGCWPIFSTLLAFRWSSFDTLVP